MRALKVEFQAEFYELVVYNNSIIVKFSGPVYIEKS